MTKLKFVTTELRLGHTLLVIGTDSVFSSRLGLRLENLLRVDSTRVDLCSKFGQKFNSTRLCEV